MGWDFRRGEWCYAVHEFASMTSLQRACAIVMRLVRTRLLCLSRESGAPPQLILNLLKAKYLESSLTFRPSSCPVFFRILQTKHNPPLVVPLSRSICLQEGRAQMQGARGNLKAKAEAIRSPMLSRTSHTNSERFNNNTRELIFLTIACPFIDPLW